MIDASVVSRNPLFLVEFLACSLSSTLAAVMLDLGHGESIVRYAPKQKSAGVDDVLIVGVCL